MVLKMILFCHNEWRWMLLVRCWSNASIFVGESHLCSGQSSGAHGSKRLSTASKRPMEIALFATEMANFLAAAATATSRMRRRPSSFSSRSFSNSRCRYSSPPYIKRSRFSWTASLRFSSSRLIPSFTALRTSILASVSMTVNRYSRMIPVPSSSSLRYTGELSPSTTTGRVVSAATLSCSLFKVSTFKNTSMTSLRQSLRATCRRSLTGVGRTFAFLFEEGAAGRGEEEM
mmetsp:Transcript_13073/g.17887  ORF Transcript_13073/g.17887 Transcript_13073/m.17887 type:complete len:231 (+) Transcript_13073:4925-5617(+)